MAHVPPVRFPASRRAARRRGARPLAHRGPGQVVGSSGLPPRTWCSRDVPNRRGCGAPNRLHARARRRARRCVGSRGSVGCRCATLTVRFDRIDRPWVRRGPRGWRWWPARRAAAAHPVELRGEASRPSPSSVGAGSASRPRADGIRRTAPARRARRPRHRGDRPVVAPGAAATMVGRGPTVRDSLVVLRPHLRPTGASRRCATSIPSHRRSPNGIPLLLAARATSRSWPSGRRLHRRGRAARLVLRALADGRQAKILRPRGEHR